MAKFIQDFIVVLVTCKNEEDPINKDIILRFPFVSLWEMMTPGAWPIFFLILFNVPFKIISLIETSQSIGGAKREYPGKTT